MNLQDVREAMLQALLDHAPHADEVAQWIADNPDAVVELIGETDGADAEQTKALFDIRTKAAD